MDILTIARGYLKAGLSVIPILPDGTKKPAIRWKEYQGRLATDAEVVEWFARPGPGIAIICGKVSGGLEVLDFDALPAYESWARRVSEQAPDLLAKLTRVRTPRGMHVYYRCAAPRGNTKLAADRNGVTLIETRGEGGYVLAPGCPPACHPLGRGYVLEAGPGFSALYWMEGRR